MLGMLAIASNHFVRSNFVVVVVVVVAAVVVVATSEVAVDAAVDFVVLIVDSNATNSIENTQL